MMSTALPFGQSPAQTGLASILATLGQGAPATGGAEAGGFEQLFAALPATQQAPLPVTGAAAIALPVTETLTSPAAPLPPAAALFGLPQPAPETAALPLPVGAAPVETDASAETAVKTPAVAVEPAKQTPDADAASAASLLIAAIAPAKGAAKEGATTIEKGAAEAPAPGNATAENDAAPTGMPAPAAPAAQPVALVETPPAAAAIIATSIPMVAQPTFTKSTADKPVTGKPIKADAIVATPRATDTANPTMPTAKPGDVAQLPPEMAASTEPKAAKPQVDAGASMTVLFQQPAATGPAMLAPAAAPAPIAERVLDLGSDDQWIAQLAADIAATQSDKGDISFRLMPRHLGRLDVSMLNGDEGVTVRLDAQHEATATIVSAAQPRLVEDLRQQGVRVADAQVTHTPAEAGRQQQQGHGQGRGAMPDTSHLIETAAERPDSETDKRAADRRGRFA